MKRQPVSRALGSFLFPSARETPSKENDPEPGPSW
jgi:hypothetical protein